jgi:hypothetical protein
MFNGNKMKIIAIYRLGLDNKVLFLNQVTQ